MSLHWRKFQHNAVHIFTRNYFIPKAKIKVQMFLLEQHIKCKMRGLEAVLSEHVKKASSIPTSICRTTLKKNVLFFRNECHHIIEYNTRKQ